MAKLTLKQFADWLSLSPESISLAKQIVEVSDPDGAYTHLQDMGEEEAAEAVEAIWFEYGSLKDTISACKEDLGLMSESKKTKKVNLTEFRELVKNIIKEEKTLEDKKNSVILVLMKHTNDRKKAVELLNKKENQELLKDDKLTATQVGRKIIGNLNKEKAQGGK